MGQDPWSKSVQILEGSQRFKATMQTHPALKKASSTWWGGPTGFSNLLGSSRPRPGLMAPSGVSPPHPSQVWAVFPNLSGNYLKNGRRHVLLSKAGEVEAFLENLERQCTQSQGGRLCCYVPYMGGFLFFFFCGYCLRDD